MTKRELIEKLYLTNDDAPIFVPVDVGNGEWAMCPVKEVAIWKDGTVLLVDFTEAT